MTQIGVDELFTAPSRPGLWSHLLCDDFSPAGLEALHEFARRMGLPARSFHNPPGRARPHYDLTPPMRERALVLGAQRLTRRQVVEFLARGRARLEDPDGGRDSGPTV